MTDRDDHVARLRDRAARLLAVALQAREDGNGKYAEDSRGWLPKRSIRPPILKAALLGLRGQPVTSRSRHNSRSRPTVASKAGTRTAAASLDRTEQRSGTDWSFRWVALCSSPASPARPALSPLEIVFLLVGTTCPSFD
jgi:hypothetical protein